LEIRHPHCSQWIIPLVAGLFVLLQGGYLVAVPPWTGPDEEEHRKYLQALAETGRLPIMAARFAPGEPRVETPEAQQPPLYYLLLTGPDRLVSGLGEAASCFFLRGFSVLFGLLTVLLTARLTGSWFPANPLIRYGTPALVAFLPTFGHIHSLVNNESLATLWGTLSFWLLLQPSQGVRQEAALGLCVGLAALTKSTSLAWWPAVLVVFVWRGRATGETALRLLRRLAVAFGVVGVVSLPWWWYTAATYGTLFPRAHYRPALTGKESWTLLFSPASLSYSLAMFSMAIVLTTWYPQWLLRKIVPLNLSGALLAGFLLVSWSGLLWHARRLRRGEIQPPLAQRLAASASAVATVSGFLGVLGQCLFVDHIVCYYGGRYLIAVAPAFTLLFLLGFSAFVRRPAARRLATVIVIGFAFLIDLAALGGVWYFYRVF